MLTRFNESCFIGSVLRLTFVLLKAKFLAKHHSWQRYAVTAATVTSIHLLVVVRIVWLQMIDGVVHIFTEDIPENQRTPANQWSDIIPFAEFVKDYLDVSRTIHTAHVKVSTRGQHVMLLKP